MNWVDAQANLPSRARWIAKADVASKKQPTGLGADLLVVELFAFLHDSQRLNEFEDNLHGERAAEYAVSLNCIYFELKPKGLDDLTHAIRFHSEGGVHKCSTIQTCWDADRLDFGRVGIKPSARYLSVNAADKIEHAYRWSRSKFQ